MKPFYLSFRYIFTVHNRFLLLLWYLWSFERQKFASRHIFSVKRCWIQIDTYKHIQTKNAKNKYIETYTNIYRSIPKQAARKQTSKHVQCVCAAFIHIRENENIEREKERKKRATDTTRNDFWFQLQVDCVHRFFCACFIRYLQCEHNIEFVLELVKLCAKIEVSIPMRASNLSVYLWFTYQKIMFWNYGFQS